VNRDSPKPHVIAILLTPFWGYDDNYE